MPISTRTRGLRHVFSYLYGRGAPIAVLVAGFVPSAAAQDTPIFPDLYGEDLIAALVANYKPGSVLSYSRAKDTLFGDIDVHDDSLTCVYTGHTIYLDPGEDPSTYAESRGINCEHTWPQSKGASGSAKSDMHHLFPTRDEVNSVRGSLPFGEVYDGWTDRWWRLSYFVRDIPETFIDAHSEEWTGVQFEPREDHKGRLARSMFYFYTMYRDQADAADPTFFPEQKDDLRTWHLASPATDAEVERSETISIYQDGCPNPFILDSTLVDRAFFPTSVTSDPVPAAPVEEIVSVSPNPFNPRVGIDFRLDRTDRVTIEVFATAGNRVAVLLDDAFRAAGEHRIYWEADGLPGGVYLCRFRTAGGIETTVRLLLLK